MARWIRQNKGSVEYVAVSVEALGIGGVWYNGIGADETADRRVIPPCSHIYQLNVIIINAGSMPLRKQTAPDPAAGSLIQADNPFL